MIVKEYPTKSATTKTLRITFEKLVRRGHDIGMVIADYADLLKPVSAQREKRETSLNLFMKSCVGFLKFMLSRLDSLAGRTEAV